MLEFLGILLCVAFIPALLCGSTLQGTDVGVGSNNVERPQRQFDAENAQGLRQLTRQLTSSNNHQIIKLSNRSQEFSRYQSNIDSISTFDGAEKDQHNLLRQT